MTRIEAARRGVISREMALVAKDESVAGEFVCRSIARGTIVIPGNNRRRIEKPCGIGEGLRTKINANIGTSKDSSIIAAEIAKMRAAISLGADTIMDLSTGSKLAETRRQILKSSKVPVGTVPIYEIAVKGIKAHDSIQGVSVEEMFAVLEEQAEDGVDFFTIHAGVTKGTLRSLKENPRILDIVSRGGAFLAEWMISNKRENPFYEHFDRLIALAKKFDITLSLGDGLRPGSIWDATDKPQIAELVILGELRNRALKAGVQVIIEGPGHVPIGQIEANVTLEKSICRKAPFYVLGPLVTDIAPGYDHITAAIGGAIAGSAGADFLCYVTPSEHLRLPTLEDVKEGVVAAKIAAHAADLAKGVRGAADWDIKISEARKARNWKKQFSLAIDRERPERYRRLSSPGTSDVCTMCSDYCSIKMAEKCLGRTK
jgi:phosphomethylpyrimidine synthase